MINYKELLTHGNEAQLEKLKENKSKCGFDNVKIYYAAQRIYQEYNELITEVNNQMLSEKDRLNRIRREAADVANYAHMIILKCDKELMKE